ncbi:uncharacterized protein LOC117186925 [Drosophila miranda]|uniref:uncharacterized protein LOC117186925 n=1 Tax=Drosophila miranda TaxID=7229 RepID=UPI00143F12C4|nr:uncharacterized protein LOC117186925 [Drosophila miranda]
MFHKAWSAPPRTGSQNPARHIHLLLVPVSDCSKAHSEHLPVSGCLCLCFLSQSPKQALKLLPVFIDSFARCSFEKSKGLPRTRKSRKKIREMPAKKKGEGKAKAGNIPGDTGSVATATVVRRQMPPRACKSKSQSAAPERRPSLSPSRQQPSRLAKKPSLTPTTGSQAPSQTIAKSRPTGPETIFERPGNEDDGPTSSHAVAFGECQRRVLALGTGEKKRNLSQKSCLKVRNTLGERSTRHMMAGYVSSYYDDKPSTSAAAAATALLRQQRQHKQQQQQQRQTSTPAQAAVAAIMKKLPTKTAATAANAGKAKTNNNGKHPPLLRVFIYENTFDQKVPILERWLNI